MTPWFHVRHDLLMPATCDCAWLLTMHIVATMRGHRSLGLLDRSHHDPFEPCAPGEFRVFESVGCLQLFAFCLYCCNVLQHLSKFVAVIAVTARLKFVWQGRVYIWCCGEGAGGGRGILDPGCSGRQIRGRLRSTLGRCGWRLPTLDVAGAVLWVPQPEIIVTRKRAGKHVHVICKNVTPYACLLYTSPSPRDRTRSRMPSSA